MLNLDPQALSSCEGGRLQSIRVIGVPAVAYDKYPGQHLLVNCIYDPRVARLPALETLTTARGDVLSILRTIAAKPWVSRFRVYRVTLYYWKMIDSDEQVEPIGQCRMYVYAIRSRGLMLPPEQLTIDYMVSNRFGQERSELDRITQLLKDNPNYRLDYWWITESALVIRFLWRIRRWIDVQAMRVRAWFGDTP